MLTLAGVIVSVQAHAVSEPRCSCTQEIATLREEVASIATLREEVASIAGIRGELAALAGAEARVQEQVEARLAGVEQELAELRRRLAHTEGARPTQGMAERTGCALLPARRPSMPNRMSSAECGRGREPASCAVHRKHQAEPVPMTTPRTRAAAGCERGSPPRSSRSPAPATKLFGTCATKQHASLRCHLKHARGIEMALEDIPMERQRTGGRRSTCRLGSC